MKSFILAAVLACSASVFAQDVVVKECSVKFTDLDFETIREGDIRIVAQGDTLTAEISQKTGPLIVTTFEIVEFEQDTVRPGIMANTSHKGLNLAERRIVDAMYVSEEPLLKDLYSAGFDLTKVRSAKVYVLGHKSNREAAAIVEAYDENHQVLGSFLSSLFVTPCR